MSNFEEELSKHLHNSLDSIRVPGGLRGKVLESDLRTVKGGSRVARFTPRFRLKDLVEVAAFILVLILIPAVIRYQTPSGDGTFPGGNNTEEIEYSSTPTYFKVPDKIILYKDGKEVELNKEDVNFNKMLFYVNKSFEDTGEFSLYKSAILLESMNNAKKNESMISFIYSGVQKSIYGQLAKEYSEIVIPIQGGWAGQAHFKEQNSYSGPIGIKLSSKVKDLFYEIVDSLTNSNLHGNKTQNKETVIKSEGVPTNVMISMFREASHKSQPELIDVLSVNISRERL